MTDSQQLLADYRQHGSDAAFRELVTRYVDLVYSTALRLVAGDTHRAEDVTQTVFVDLARQTRTLPAEVRLGGWLHRHTCFVAANTLRGERRRQARERQAVEMNALQNHSEADFSQVAPLLDEAINELADADRTAVLLRFFEQQDFRAVGAALGSTEDAARMRVTRALEKLEEFLKRRGVTTTAASLGVVLTANAIQAAPVGLAVTVSTAAALAGTTLATTATAIAAKTIAMTTLQKTLIGAALTAAVGTGLYEARQVSMLRSQVQTLQQQQAPLVEQIQQLTRERQDALTKPTSSASNSVSRRFDWESVESADYKQYIANLRSSGCPEETIRDIIHADVHKLYEEKKAQVRRSAPPLVYWREDAQAYIRGSGREMWLKINALNEERNGVLRTLGIEPDYKMQMVKRSDALDLMLDFLPDEDKRTQILRLRKEVEDKLAVRKDNNPAEVDRLRKEMDDAVKQLLTPGEALQYDLRMSVTASMMQNQLAAFDRTEEEFVAIFKLRKAFDDEFSPLNAGRETEAERAKRAEAAEQLKEQIRLTLGSSRYADYELAQNHDFQQLYRVATEAGLGVSEAKQVYAMRQQASAQAVQIRSDQNLSPDQRANALGGIRQETEKSIQAVLGEKGWAQFIRNGNNRWLEAINP